MTFRESLELLISTANRRTLMSGQEIWDMAHSLASQVETLEQVERDLHQKIRDILSFTATAEGNCEDCGLHLWYSWNRAYTEEGEIHAH